MGSETSFFPALGADESGLFLLSVDVDAASMSEIPLSDDEARSLFLSAKSALILTNCSCKVFFSKMRSFSLRKVLLTLSTILVPCFVFTSLKQDSWSSDGEGSVD